MAAVTIRNLTDETHRALKLRAARNGRSTEAEIREILEAVVNPETRLKVGTALKAFGEKYGGIDLEPAERRQPVEPATFE